MAAQLLQHDFFNKGMKLSLNTTTNMTKSIEDEEEKEFYVKTKDHLRYIRKS